MVIFLSLASEIFFNQDSLGFLKFKFSDASEQDF